MQTVDSGDVNEYLEACMGERFTAKNFRTWHASVMGLECLRAGEGRMPMKALLDCVAGQLGNTPAVTRKSYIHLAVIDLVDRQENGGGPAAACNAMADTRRAWLIELLQESPSAAELLLPPERAQDDRQAVLNSL